MSFDPKFTNSGKVTLEDCLTPEFNVEVHNISFRAGFDSGFESGDKVGFQRAIELLRSEEAQRKCEENTLGSGNFVSHNDWAWWLEERRDA